MHSNCLGVNDMQVSVSLSDHFTWVSTDVCGPSSHPGRLITVVWELAHMKGPFISSYSSHIDRNAGKYTCWSHICIKKKHDSIPRDPRADSLANSGTQHSSTFRPEAGVQKWTKMRYADWWSCPCTKCTGWKDERPFQTLMNPTIFGLWREQEMNVFQYISVRTCDGLKILKMLSSTDISLTLTEGEENI